MVTPSTPAARCRGGLEKTLSMYLSLGAKVLTPGTLEQLRVERLFGLLKRLSVLFLILGFRGVDDIGGLQLLEAFPGLAEPRPAKAARVHARLAARCERVFGVATAAAVVFAVAVSFITVAHLAKHLLESVTESPRR